MDDLEKAKLIISKINEGKGFDLIDYYKLESRAPFDLLKSVKPLLTSDENRIFSAFAGKNKEGNEWKERHYVTFYDTKLNVRGREITLEDKKLIINRIKSMGLKVNDRTVNTMVSRYIVEVPVQEENNDLSNKM